MSGALRRQTALRTGVSLCLVGFLVACDQERPVGSGTLRLASHSPVSLDVGAHLLGKRVRCAFPVINDLGEKVSVIGYNSYCSCHDVRFLSSSAAERRPSVSRPVVIMPKEKLYLVIEQMVDLRGPFLYPLELLSDDSKSRLPLIMFSGYGCDGVFSMVDGKYKDWQLYQGLKPGDSRRFEFSLFAVNGETFVPELSPHLPDHTNVDLTCPDGDGAKWIVSGRLVAGLLDRVVGGMISVIVDAKPILALRVIGIVDSPIGLQGMTGIELGVLDVEEFAQRIKLCDKNELDPQTRLRVLSTDNRTPDRWTVQAAFRIDNEIPFLVVSGSVHASGALEASVRFSATGALQGTDTIGVSGIARSR